MNTHFAVKDISWRLIQVLAAISTLALVGACVSLVWLTRIQSGREEDRITSDVAGCQRGNENRAAQSDQIRRVVVKVAQFAGSDAEEIELLLGDLADELEPIVTHCVDVVPGADPETPDFAP